MKRKINVLLITVILTIIIFGVSIYMQRKLIAYVPTRECLILTQDIEAYEKLDESLFKKVDMPIDILSNTEVATDFNEIKELYAKQDMHSGQLAIKDAFDTSENLSIFECEDGLEKVAIKIKASENGVSYQLRENANINVYATLRTEYANKFLESNTRTSIGDAENGYTIIKLLENTKVLGMFDEDGIQIEKNENGAKPDTIMIAVNSNEALQINLLREIATFNVSEASRNVKAEVQNESVL